MTFQQRLKTLRLSKGWSQEEMANQLNLSVTGYAKIERGETDTNLSRLEQIAQVLGVDLVELFGVSKETVFHLAGTNYTHRVDNSQNFLLMTSDTQLQHELEKSQLLLKERNREIQQLQMQIEQLQMVIGLIKTHDE